MCFWLILLAAGSVAQCRDLVGVILQIVASLVSKNNSEKVGGGVLPVFQNRGNNEKRNS
jgi:hypothetical protein